MEISDQISKCNIIHDLLLCDVYLFDSTNKNIYSMNSSQYPDFFNDFISEEMNTFAQHISQSNKHSVHYYSSLYFLNFIGISFWKKDGYNGSVLLGPLLENKFNQSDFSMKYFSQIPKVGNLEIVATFYENLPVFSINQSNKLITLINNLFLHSFIHSEINNISQLKSNPVQTTSKLNIFDNFTYWKEQYNKEKRLEEAITNGNLTKAVEIIKSAMLNLNSKSNKSSINRAKYLLTLTNSSLTRIAIEKNVPLMVAYTTSSSFGLLIEQASHKECDNLIVQIIQDYTRLINKYDSSITSNLINKALNTINKHALESLTLKDISQELHVSSSHLSRKFKEEMQMTITDYIHKVKIDTSIELIKLKRYSLLEISEMVGYINYSHFNKWFNKFTNISPKQYTITK